MRGRAPQYSKHRTRTGDARNFARQLRENSTAAEKRLWRLLRDRRFADFKFRRQYACGIYFLDFYCTTARLAVELDGGGHGFPDQRAKDEQRNVFLATKGIKVLRFWNHQMRGELESIRFEIWHALMERTGRVDEIAGFVAKPAPSPQPSPPRGRGEFAFGLASIGDFFLASLGWGTMVGINATMKVAMQSQLATEVNTKGFAFLPSHEPDQSSEDVMTRFGAIEKLAGLNEIQELTPRNVADSPPNIYSGSFGYGEFPFHTDLAHWFLPPHYLVLRCIEGIWLM